MPQGLARGLAPRLRVVLGSSCGGRLGWDFYLDRCRRPLRFINRPDHIERAFRIVFEFIAQDSLAAVQRVLEADELSFEA
jgi:hypothetical protein